MRTSSLLEGWSEYPGQRRFLEQKRARPKRTGDHNDTGLAGATLRGPGEVARVETERTVLVVATAGADGVDALGTDTGVRRLAARLEGSLLPCTQLSEIGVISMCVEQAQNAWGRSLR